MRTRSRYSADMQRWASGYAVEWTPILTFRKRRLQLLDWFEDEINPIAFMDEHDSIGVALVDESLRVEVTRSGLRISVGADSLGVAHVGRAVQGVFEVLDPQDAILQAAAGTRTFELPGAVYLDERTEAARRITRCGAVSAAGHTYRPTDMSALIDFESAESVVQAEWGIVERDELLQRVSDPYLGRLGNHIRPTFSGEPTSGVPDVALLADLVYRRKAGGRVVDWPTLKSEMDLADELVSEIARSIYDGYQRGRGSSEFSEIA